MPAHQENEKLVPFTLTIGYKKADGSIKVLATLDNRDKGLPTDSFLELAGNVRRFYMHSADPHNEYEIFHRDDAPSEVMPSDVETAPAEMAPAG